MGTINFYGIDFVWKSSRLHIIWGHSKWASRIDTNKLCVYCEVKSLHTDSCHTMDLQNFLFLTSTVLRIATPRESNRTQRLAMNIAFIIGGSFHLLDIIGPLKMETICTSETSRSLRSKRIYIHGLSPRTILTERPPFFGEVIANFWG
jgi:hypothetical protein